MPDSTMPLEPAPVSNLRPVSESQRNRLLDALRGVALLGILLMNIPFFAMPDHYSEAFRSDPASINFWVSALISVFFEGKMRALFGLIFGAGVVLFVSKKEQAGRSVTGLFYRRMGWLVLFGLIHAHLVLWLGDILYLYGLCGMIVYLFRNVSPRKLVMCVAMVAVLDCAINAGFYYYMHTARLAFLEAKRAEAAGTALTETQKDAVTQWRDLEQTIFPNAEDAKENTRKMKSGYAEVASHVRKLALEWETKAIPIMIWDSVALMLLGIALYRWGFLTGDWTDRAYWMTMLIGYGIGLPLVLISAYDSFIHEPNLNATLARVEAEPFLWVRLIYPFQRILLVLAHVSALVLLYKSGRFPRLFRRLEAVGQTALSNYVLQSVICTLVFFGYGLNRFGEWEFYQLYLFVLGVWAVQLTLSPLWLRYFQFGPLEWLWRSLTYWKPQPFFRREAASA